MGRARFPATDILVCACVSCAAYVHHLMPCCCHLNCLGTAAAETQRCRVFSPSLSNANFRAAYNPQNVGYGSTLSLRMNGLDGGTRVEPTYARQTYGQFQVRAQIPCGSGVISAFYVSARFSKFASGQTWSDCIPCALRTAHLAHCFCCVHAACHATYHMQAAAQVSVRCLSCHSLTHV